MVASARALRAEARVDLQLDNFETASRALLGSACDFERGGRDMAGEQGFFFRARAIASSPIGILCP
jgi:hypothetical protein